MSNILRQLQEIENRLSTLRHYQQSMNGEIARLEEKLRQVQLQVNAEVIPPMPDAGPLPAPGPVITAPSQKTVPQQQPLTQRAVSSTGRSALETFIGTNLISKIGILITIIGVFIGARYAIDRELISPGTRIILSYIFAALLAAIGLRLKKQYNAFSAVLTGGSIAIIYFSTYVAFDYYALFPIAVAFAIMFVTTLLSIALALWYDQKIIALIGQVAAYAIPILLSTGSGKVGVLFSYVSIINAGLMVLSFRKNWKIIYRIAFSITWLMFVGWVGLGNDTNLSWSWSLFFISVCFITFYVTYLSYKIFRKELYNIIEVGVLLLNAIIFYSIGYVLIDRQFEGTNLLTLFTLANAAVHMIAGYMIHRLRLADESVRLFLFGQAVAFITIAIPVKLDGGWVTMLWSIETAVVMYIAVQSKRKLYFQLCLVIMSATLISLLEDWVSAYDVNRLTTAPFLNYTFFTSLITSAAFLFAAIIVRRAELPFTEQSRLRTVFLSWMPVVFIGVLYFGIFNEIGLYYGVSQQTNEATELREWFGVAMLHFYTCVFFAAANFTNVRVLKSEQMFYLLTVIALIIVVMQLTSGLWALSHLHNTSYAWVRYLNFAGVALLFYSVWLAKSYFAPDRTVQMTFSISFNITLLAIICNEYIYWVRLYDSSNEYKLGLSIIFAGYALVMLFRGLLKDISHLRISAIVLFGVAIVKLFAYDLKSMSTIGKTIVLIVLGIILLAASFLYNRFVKKEV